MAPLILDAHLHLYPSFDLAAVLDALARNLGSLGDGPRGAILAARHGEPVFGALPATPPRGVEVRPTPDGAARVVARAGAPPVTLFPGRQVVTSERLEVLALLTAAPVPDGLPAAATVAAVRAAGGIPALPWSPGKWLGARGRLVRALVRGADPGTLLLADTAMRPACFPEPGAMREARRRGIGIVAGSDPLPAPGEERVAGRYATVLEGDLDPAQPLAALRRLLEGPPASFRPAGRRGLLAAAVARQLRYARARRGAGAGTGR